MIALYEYGSSFARVHGLGERVITVPYKTLVEIVMHGHVDIGGLGAKPWHPSHPLYVFVCINRTDAQFIKHHLTNRDVTLLMMY